MMHLCPQPVSLCDQPGRVRISQQGVREPHRRAEGCCLWRVCSAAPAAAWANIWASSSPMLVPLHSRAEMSESTRKPPRVPITLASRSEALHAHK